jgi:hypothetical protein
VRLGIYDGATTTTGATSATTGSFVTLTATATIGASATLVQVQIQMIASGTSYFDHAMLVIGPAPAPFQPLHPQEDLARCQRYYEIIHGDVANAANIASYGAAGANGGMPYFYRVTKYGTPTVTKVGTWGVTNCSQPAIGFYDRNSATVYATVTALGSFLFGPNSTDDYLSIESNP